MFVHLLCNYQKIASKIQIRKSNFKIENPASIFTQLLRMFCATLCNFCATCAFTTSIYVIFQGKKNIRNTQKMSVFKENHFFNKNFINLTTKSVIFRCKNTCTKHAQTCIKFLCEILQNFHFLT